MKGNTRSYAPSHTQNVWILSRNTLAWILTLLSSTFLQFTHLFNKELLQNCHHLFYYKPFILERIYTEVALAHNGAADVTHFRKPALFFKHYFLKIKFPSQHWSCPWAFALNPSQAQSKITSFLKDSRNLQSVCLWEEEHQGDIWVPYTTVSWEDCHYGKTLMPHSHLIKVWTSACCSSGSGGDISSCLWQHPHVSFLFMPSSYARTRLKVFSQTVQLLQQLDQLHV